jgi:hypothetical protein
MRGSGVARRRGWVTPPGGLGCGLTTAAEIDLCAVEIRSKLPFHSSLSAASVSDMAIVIRFSYFKSDALAVNRIADRACRFTLGWI